VTSDRQDVVPLTGGPALAVRRTDGPLRPFLLVHDLDADSRSWDEVAERLYAAGHQVAAVDLRGHGGSDTPATGYDTDTCADDLSSLLDALGFTGARAPVLVGHGWGANVAMSLAARRDGVAAVCCLDGGWIRPAWQYGSFEECWAAWKHGKSEKNEEDEEDANTRSIVRSLFFGEPRGWFPLVKVPVVLCPVVPPDGRPDPAGRGTAARTGVAEALSRLPRARISWYYGEGNAVGTDPGKLVDDLLTLAADAEPQID
jgi:pimeloyl-ACP methyl ester carboxylesterase